MNNYPVGDYIIRLKNAALAGRRSVEVPSSKFLVSVAGALKKLGVVESFEVKSGVLITKLAYHKKQPVLLDIKLVSKPGLRRYMSATEIAGRKRRNASILVLSSPVGVISSKEALKKRVGGEIIAEVW